MTFINTIQNKWQELASSSIIIITGLVLCNYELIIFLPRSFYPPNNKYVALSYNFWNAVDVIRILSNTLQGDYKA